MNKFVLPVTLLLGFAAAPAVAQDSTVHCTLPGELVASDATGDATNPAPGHDVLDVYVAEVPNDKDETKIYFTLTVNQATPQAVPLTSYQVSFMLDDGVDRFMLYNPYPLTPAATVFPGTDLMFAVGQNGADGYTIDGPADAESSASADGTITLVLSEKQLRQIKPGVALTNIAGVSQLNALATLDQDVSNAPGLYLIKGSESCAAKNAAAKHGSSLLAGAITPGLLLMLAGFAAFRRRI